MAKPKHGRCNNHAGPIPLSSSSSSSSSSSIPPHPHPRGRLHHHSRSFPRFPSSAVLSALAIIAAAPSAVAGGPLPTPLPTFLCPSIERVNVHPSLPTLPTLLQRAATSAPLPTTSASQYRALRVVADKYMQGSDNFWRKTNAWTLYGQTCCSSSTSSTSAIYSQQTSSLITTSTSTPSPVQFDTSALPAGWNNTTNVNSATEPTIILVLAIILAGSICVFMIVFVIWRRRKKKSRDIERKLAHKLGADDDSQDNAGEKDAPGKMRTWARASARWKSNIRLSARRRRKKPIASSIVNRPLSPTFSDSQQISAVVPSASSRRGSLVSQESDHSRPEAVPCLNGDAIEPPTVPHDSPCPASPPTYGASFIPRLSHPPSSAVSNSSSTPSPDSLRTARRSDLPSFIEDEPLPYIPPSDGHIATDDKAQLAHIRELASSPPTMVNATGASTTQSVSAPEWHEVEDDLEDLGIDLSEVPISFRKLGLPPSFPLPPSKADVPFGYLDNHPLRYGEEDDITVSLPIPGPSRTSLGTSPSAPPIDDPGLEPSAPSLEGEDDLFQDWDGASPYVLEAPTAVDLDSIPTCAIESSVSQTVSVSIRESVAGDGVLPRYHP